MVFIDHESLSQTRHYKVRPIGMLLLSLFFIFLISAGTFSLIFFTSLKEKIPGYTDPALKEEAGYLRNMTDSLSKMVEDHAQIIKSLKAAELVKLSEGNFSAENDFVPSDSQSSRDFAQYEGEAPAQMPPQQGASPGQPSSSGGLPPQSSRKALYGNTVMNLVSPVDGIRTNPFDPNYPQEPHYGIDIAADENSLIRSVADGIVIFSEYSNQTGYVIAIAHSDYNLISFYKHNSRLFKKVGSYVFSGEAIAVIGNSGTNSSGTHLHFELWYDNNPVNPEDYILF